MHIYIPSRSINVMQPVGQLLLHNPQPTQLSLSTNAKHPFLTETAFFLQKKVHSPHATHRFSSTTAYFFDFTFITSLTKAIYF